MSKQEVFTYLEDGSILWNASLILLRYLSEKRRGEFQGKRVLELGAGKGHLAMGLSRLGAHVTTTEAACQEPGARGEGEEGTCKCWGCVEQLRRGVQAQLKEVKGAEESGLKIGEWTPVPPEKDGEEAGAIRVMPLDWGPDGTLRTTPSSEMFGSVDVVVMSECIYNQSDDSLYDDDFHDGLVWTLQQIVQRPGTLVYNVFVDRPFSWMFFAKVNDMPGKPFKVEQVDEKEYDDGGIKDADAALHIHRLLFQAAPESATSESES